MFKKGHRIRLDIQPRDGVGASVYRHYPADYNIKEPEIQFTPAASGNAICCFRSSRQSKSIDRSTSRGIGRGNNWLLVPLADGIVAPDPVDLPVTLPSAGFYHVLLRRAVVHVLEARIGEGEPLHSVHARDADAAEIGERLHRIAARFEPSREDVGVLEGLAGALSGVGQHRVRRVADELDAAAAPIVA